MQILTQRIRGSELPQVGYYRGVQTQLQTSLYPQFVCLQAELCQARDFRRDQHWRLNAAQRVPAPQPQRSRRMPGRILP